MDPDCAICSQPANAQCSCEAKALDLAVRQAEQRMMASVFNDIRAWVRVHAQDYILEYFSVHRTIREDAHAQHVRRITDAAAYYYNARPHPSEMHAAEAELKRGFNEDWRASVQRYPEVLEYFYGLVELSLPADDDPGVSDPPLSALEGGARKLKSRGPREESRERVRIGGPLGPNLGGGVMIRDRKRDKMRPGAPLVPQPPHHAPNTVLGGGGGGDGKRTTFAMPGYGNMPPGTY